MRKNVILLLVCILSLSATTGSAAPVDVEIVEQLRADYSALLQARQEFKSLMNAGRLGDAEKSDYAAWIRQLDDRVREGCDVLVRAGTAALPADLPCRNMTPRNPAPAAIDIAAETTEAEKTSRMVEQLNGSLGDFDERLLREQDRVRAKTPRDTSAAAGAGSMGSTGSAGSAGEGSDEPGGQDGSMQGEGSGTASRGGEGDQQPRSGDEADTGTTTTGRQGTPGRPLPGAKAPPDDIPDGSDDDVVARQLREAAEKETDPELKKKLWEEYRRYKAGIK